MRILSLDVGTSRVGLAIGETIAREYTTLTINDQVFDQISKIVAKEEIDALVVGLPVRSQGEPGTINQTITEFIEHIKAVLPHLKITTLDEAYTTAAAESELKNQGCSPHEIKTRIDQVAARILLEQYFAEKPQ